LTYLSRIAHNVTVKPHSVRTGIDLPPDLHRRLREAAARQGCSARQLILASIERAVEQAEPTRGGRRLSLDPPLIPPAGRRIDLTNEQIYDLIEFP
jgi:plasmid stability protein